MVAIGKEIAAEHGAAWRAELNSTGSVNGHQKIEFGVDTGVEARVLIMGNAAAGRPYEGPTE
jgi:hypothetical protein